MKSNLYVCFGFDLACSELYRRSPNVAVLGGGVVWPGVGIKFFIFAKW